MIEIRIPYDIVTIVSFGLNIVLGILEIITFIWAKKERLRNRDFRNMAKGWVTSVDGIAHACTDLEKDCKGGKFSSVRDAGAAAKKVCLPAHTLLSGMKAALNVTEEAEADDR